MHYCFFFSFIHWEKQIEKIYEAVTLFYIEVVAFFKKVLMELDFSIFLTVCGRQHFLISFFTLKKAKSERFLSRDAKTENFEIKAPSGFPRVLLSQGF